VLPGLKQGVAHVPFRSLPGAAPQEKVVERETARVARRRRFVNC